MEKIYDYRKKYDMLQITNENDKYDENFDRAYSSFTIQLIDCARYKCDSFKIKKRITSEYYTILTVIKGALSTSNGDNIKRGNLLFLPKFSNLVVESEESTEFIQIIFKSSGLKASFPRKPKTLTVEKDIFISIERLYRIFTFHTAIEGVKEAILLDIINGLSKYFSAAYSEVSTYQKICQWIETNSERDITAEDVADALGYSREHLNRIVKSIDGENLSSKIAKYRLENIKALCEAEELSVAEIAEKLGFYSRELLCKYFKYHMGISINNYRAFLSYK